MPETPAPQFGQNLVSAATAALHLGQALVVAVVICCGATGELLRDAAELGRIRAIREVQQRRVEGQRSRVGARDHVRHESVGAEVAGEPANQAVALVERVEEALVEDEQRRTRSAEWLEPEISNAR